MREIIVVNVRPALASLAMAAVVLFCEQFMEQMVPLLRLLLVVALGSCAFIVSLVLLWRLAGSPDTIEKSILSVAKRQLVRQ
jgi:hypothetical protein